MSNLDEILNSMLDAENEAKKLVDAAKPEAEEYFRKTKEEFEAKRKSDMAAAQEKAKKILADADAEAEVYVKQVRDACREEEERITKRFEENAGKVIDALVSETADMFAEHTKAGKRG